MMLGRFFVAKSVRVRVGKVVKWRSFFLEKKTCLNVS